MVAEFNLLFNSTFLRASLPCVNCTWPTACGEYTFLFANNFFFWFVVVVLFFFFFFGSTLFHSRLQWSAPTRPTFACCARRSLPSSYVHHQNTEQTYNRTQCRLFHGSVNLHTEKIEKRRNIQPATIVLRSPLFCCKWTWNVSAPISFTKKREAEQVCTNINGLFAFNVRHIKEFGKGVIRQDTQRAEGTGSALPLCTLEIIIISVAAQRFWALTNEIELNTLFFGEWHEGFVLCLFFFFFDFVIVGWLAKYVGFYDLINGLAIVEWESGFCFKF